jgi:hypothetical protein
MAMNLVWVSQSALEKVAAESGLALTAEQVREIVEAEGACLSESRRVSFGESAAVRIVREFASLPFVSEDDAAKTIAELTESFYDLREDFPASTTDAEILESLREAFDGDAAGDAGFAAALAGEALSKRQDFSTYEIADDDGNVYRWDPEEWHDDITADGWCGERWEDVDE